MKFLIFTVCLAYAAAAPTSSDQTAQILRSDYQQSPEGGFNYVLETDNGISAQVTGTFKQFGKDEAAVVQTGSHQYTAPDGTVIQEVYTADENGYHVEGPHLPTPPPTQEVPEYIVKSLAYIAAHPYVEKKQ